MIAQWHVQEASKVKAGDLLLEMRDIDPQFKNRIESQRDNLSNKFAAKKEELKSYQLQQKNLNLAREAKIVAAKFKRDVAQQKINAPKGVSEYAPPRSSAFEFVREALIEPTLVVQNQ